MQDKYIDNTGDKKYFTIIPNYIANHSSANDQALYLQMKKIVGEREGVCYASEKYFKDKLQIGSKALKKSIQYLLDHKWIEYTGLQEVETNGGVQKVKTYLVKDIWQKNIDYYQGVSEREPLTESKGVSESNSRGVQKEAKGVAFEQQIRTYNNNIKEEQCFNLFWNEYPNKENKKKAQQIWKSKNLDSSLEDIIDFIKRAKNTDRWYKKIIPHPSTFLNQERWNDDLTSYGERKVRAYYRGDPVVEKNGKKYVIRNGDWLEFCGNQEELEYK